MRSGVFLLALFAVASALSYTPTQHGVAVNMADGHVVELAVEGMQSFRVSAIYDGQPPAANPSWLIDSHTNFAQFKIYNDGFFVNLATSFGTVGVAPSGAFQFLNANGQNITSSPQLSTYSSIVDEKAGLIPIKGPNNTCAQVFPNTDASGGRRTPAHPNPVGGQNAQSCCAICNSDPDCTFWVLEPDSTGNCWLLMDVVKRVPANNRNTGGVTLPGPSIINFNLNRQCNSNFYGAGGGGGSGLVWSSSTPYVTNTAFQAPHYYSNEGYAALGVSQLDHDDDPTHYPASWSQTGGSGCGVQWTIRGKRADLYLIPSPNNAYAAYSGYWELTGRPKVPPRYAFGYLACRWGWSNRTYIETVLTDFRQGNYPIDAFISDFQWYTPVPDYTLPPQGSPSFIDFSYNNATFPEPVQQLQDYHNNFHVRFGGIRKPRLGNSGLISMAQNNGWILPNAARNLNYSIQAVRDWYGQQLNHFFSDGVNFWWNDEGETQYFTFYGWNLAQVDALANYNPSTRFFSINRSYQPGMQKFGAAIWTGDISVSWQALQQTVGYLLNWGLAGVSYLTCDIGGFNGGNSPGDLLTRWYAVGSFLGIFRVHSYLEDVPHFPFYYPAPYSTAMRKFQDLRYQLVPYLYSLAHQQYEQGLPINRPLFLEFPSDTTAQTLNTQWLVGANVLVAPVLNQDASVNIYLPAATWFGWGSTTTYQGPNTLNWQNVAIDFVPVFVRAGSIIPLAVSGLQYTDQLPGGPLQVQVYAGADATFELDEDDGISYDYTVDSPNSSTAVRRTLFSWSDASKTLSWQVIAGAFSDEHTFTQVQVTAYFANGSKQTSTVQTIGQSGTVTFH